MEDLYVEVQPDYLERLARSKNPVRPLAELIWNSLDADATNVEVSIRRNQLGRLESVKVVDDGHGMLYDRTVNAFGKLGGSWKRTADRTAKEKRFLHGEVGRGRIRAFGLGHTIEWKTVYSSDAEEEKLKEYTIRGSTDDLRHFEVSEVVDEEDGETGTTVEVFNLRYPERLQDTDKIKQKLTEEFAPYLKKYPNVQLVFDGDIVDPSEIEDLSAEYDLQVEDTRGRSEPARLRVIEWTIQTDRAIYLCDRNGFTLGETHAGIQAKGLEFPRPGGH